MQTCPFCNIVDRSLDATILYEDKELIVIDDIHPQAPTHQLIIPKQHIATLNDLTTDHAKLIGQMVLLASKIATELHMEQSGYRTVFNCNPGGGQAVFHLHLHLLAGRQMRWPPG
jgi:histidine triad (HIT) family protein